MKTALLLNAVDPSIGGVLIRGQKGTAKSTAVRALAALLPPLEAVSGCSYHCSPDVPELLCDDCLKRWDSDAMPTRVTLPTPMVELPLGATEDRVAGTVHLEETLKSGRRQFEPGLLAAANRGILYVDEVNLLEDHLVDLLLDAAASGVNRVEREGLCLTHPARFLLIGTMNPEEGELRPQFLDRFGLSVTVTGVNDLDQRRELLRRRIEFEKNPRTFVEHWSAAEVFLAQRIEKARQNLSRIEVPEEALQLAANLALQLEVHGHRADIALIKTATALTALLELHRVESAQIREAAWFALPHRLPGSLFAEEGRLEKILDQTLSDKRIDPLCPASTAGQEVWAEADDAFEFPGAAAAGSMLFETFKKKLQNG